MSMINAIAFGARYVIVSKLQQNLLADEKITTQLQHEIHSTLKAFVEQQMAAMSTSVVVTSLGEIKDLEALNLSVEIYGDVSADFLLKEIVSAQVYKVLAPVTDAVIADNATPTLVNAAVLNIDCKKLQIDQGEQSMATGTENGLPKEDLDACDLGALNDQVYEMFFAQNSIIDMDLRFNMIEMTSTPDETLRDDLRNYAGKIEEFLQYAKEYPERISNALTLLNGRCKSEKR